MKDILNAVKKLRVCVIGDAMLDHYIFGDCERLSPEAPVPILKVERDVYKAGAAANVALNMRCWGANVALLCCIGEDAAGKTLREVLAGDGVAVQSFPNTCETVVKTRVIARNQQLCRIDREGGCVLDIDCKDSQYLLESMLKDCNAVILSDYAKGVVSQDLIQKVLEIRQKRGFFLAVDPKPKGCLNYAGVDLITPNRAEAFQLAGLDPHDYKTFPAEAICRSIYQKYPSRYLVITLGKDGMLLCESGEVVAIMPTYAREVFDVSGAGDTSIAALTVGLTAGFPLKSVAHFANTAAGVVVGKLGTATATPGEVLGYHE